jgi:hypothetical protein
VLLDLTPEQIVLASSRAANECNFFHEPATLREFSGRPVRGDSIAAEAKEQLLHILQGRRSKHGPRLHDIPGKVTHCPED